MLIRIKGAISNCYLLLGARPLLVDTGAPGDLPKILATFKSLQLDLKQLALILLTHGHSDHAGNAAELRARSGRPVALHTGDATLARNGENGILVPQTNLGRWIRPFVDEPFQRFEPDILFRESFSLEPYGVRGKVVPTPGHTAGSASVVLANGEALIGDVMRGSLVWPNRARPSFFCNDAELNANSSTRLASEGLIRCHPGQFGSFPGAELGRFIAPTTRGVLELSGEPA
jgi:glyoxylase-like metal-dependent hydrolase (beta-lactamase superfamily II)